MKLFVYGTLTNPETMEDIVQKPLGYGQEAILKDHIKYDTTFGISVALPKKGEEVKGLIYDNLNENDFEKLDIYEECHLDPPLYLKKIITVYAKNKPVKCFVYIGNEEEVKKSLIIND